MNFNRKLIIYIVGVVAILIIVGGIIWLNSKDKNLVLYRDPGLTAEERTSREQKIQDLKHQLADTAKSQEDKYKLQVELGLTYFGLGNYRDAQEAYLSATKILPDNPTAWAELYVVENAMQDYETAKKSIQEAIKRNPSSAQYWRWLIELGTGPLQIAVDKLEQTYKDALQNTGDHVDILTLYAGFLEKKGDLAGAIMQWKKAIEKNPAGKAIYESEIARIQGQLK